MDEIQHMCAEFRYAVSELTADTALSPVPLTASSKRSTVDMAEEIPIENLRLDVVQVEYVVRDVLRVAVTHDVLQELLQVELNRSYDEAYARVSKGAPAPIAECTLDFVRFARLVHEIKKLLSRTSVSWFPFDPTSITRRVKMVPRDPTSILSCTFQMFISHFPLPSAIHPSIHPSTARFPFSPLRLSRLLPLALSFSPLSCSVDQAYHPSYHASISGAAKPEVLRP